MLNLLARCLLERVIEPELATKIIHTLEIRNRSLLFFRVPILISGFHLPASFHPSLSLYLYFYLPLPISNGLEGIEKQMD